MEASALTKIAPPLILGLMMLGMGMSMVKDDFKHVMQEPKAIAVGMLGQLIVLPAVAFLLCYLSNARPEICVGVMIVAACPGGPGSNLVVHLCKGDTALSVSLTALSSLVTGLTIPIVTQIATSHFIGEASQLEPDILVEMGIKVCILTLPPVFLGMWLRTKNQQLAIKAEKPVKVSAVIFLVVLIAGIAFKERSNLLNLLQEAGILGCMLCVTTMILGYSLARGFRLNQSQSISVMIEVGIQNAALAFLITTTMLDNTAMAIPAAVYSPVMLTTSGLLIAWFNRRSDGASHLSHSR
jgi:bile acid:Na+ symporter, BASS family